MTAHIGIELAGGITRIVEVDVSRAKDVLRPTGLRRFATFRTGSPEMNAALREMRGRPAAVVVWGAPGDHRQVMVTAGKYDAMRREAGRSLAKAGVETRGALIDIARAPSTASSARRPVVVALASGAAVRAALRPLVEAGIELRTVATPATALVSLARVRRALSTSNVAAAVHAHEAIAIDACVAIQELSTCITLLRDGCLVAARELSWGFQEGRRGALRRREDIAARFADELDEFLTTVGGSPGSIRHMAMCGAVPELRSVAAVMTERFDIEAEPLDAPFGIDGSRSAAVPDDQCAAMWLAWAAAVDQPAPLSLLHAHHRRAAQARLARAAIAAGVMVGVGLGWQAAQSPMLRVEPLPGVHRTAEPALPQPVVNEPVSTDVRSH